MQLPTPHWTALAGVLASTLVLPTLAAGAYFSGTRASGGYIQSANVEKFSSADGDASTSVNITCQLFNSNTNTTDSDRQACRVNVGMAGQYVRARVYNQSGGASTTLQGHGYN